MKLFEIAGEDVDLGYRNLREGVHRVERDIVGVLEAMWERYAPYADTDFVEGFAREPDARFWEMFVGCALLDAGKTLLLAADRPPGGWPDICVVEDDRRIWIEAIAPGLGDSEQDRIPELVPLNEGGRVRNQPRRQIQLRITSALWTKSKVIERYIRSGAIVREDVVLVAIGATRFGHLAGGMGLPIALTAVFPIGPEFVRIDTQTMEIVAQGFEPSFEITRAGGAIPQTAFIDKRFEHISGLLWSRVSIGNMSRRDRPLSLIHNPLARTPMPVQWGAWDREFVTTQTGEQWKVREVLDESQRQDLRRE